MRRGRGEGESGFGGGGGRRTRHQEQQSRGQTVKKRSGNQMAGLYREDSQGQGQPNSWAGESGVESRMCQPYPVPGWD